MASSSSSTSHRHQIKDDVFISFRGSDIRHGFLSHLTKQLSQKHIGTYVDERLESGDEISSALLKAIEGSEISLIIFSKDYAFSKWCLVELVKIIERMEVKDQIVIPVFYNIDPSDVRYQKGTYGDAFAQHEQNFNDDSSKEKLQSWKSALNKAANLSGYHYPPNFENESQLIDVIVKDIVKKLDDIYPTESKCLVGFDRNLACVEALLEIDESQEVRIIGIWGMGGMGKTTLARAVCDKFSSKFESCCFMENVREESKKINGLSYLLQKLFSVLLDQENINMNDVVKIRSFKRRLCRKKVLVALDDIDTLEQIEYLAGERLYLGSGSRVIITSRDKHVLNSGGVHAIHEIKELNFHESLELFSLNAFDQKHPKMGYEKLSESAVVYAEGVPLALKVLGSHLLSKNKETWESELRKLRKFPNKQIQNVLKLSYDELDNEEKNIFLDIAFFYKGEYKDNVIRLLDVNYFADSGINSLLDKALVYISNDNTIQMHDLVQQMGWEIVRQECEKDPGKRSRLRDIEEVYEVLKNKKGTDAIEGIILHAFHIQGLRLCADAFKNMTKLRILKFYSPCHVRSCNVHHPTSIESFSDKSSYLVWDGYPFKPLPSGFNPESLSELSMTKIEVNRLWKEIQDFVNLRRMDISRSKEWIELPNFSKAQNLEWMDIESCESFCNDHPHILSLSMIVTLKQVRCKDVKTLHGERNLRSQRNLDVSFCCSLKELSLPSQEITELNLVTPKFEIVYSSIGSLSEPRKLVLSGSKALPIKELCCLRSLEEIPVSDCKQINGKPEVHILFDALHSLREQFLVGCGNFFEVPNKIGSLSSLKYLGLKGSSIGSLPDCIKHLPMLRTIYLTNCRRLRYIPELPASIMHLDATNCTSLEAVFTLTTSALQQEDITTYFFSFINCLKLDEQSLLGIMNNAYLSLKRAVYHKFEGSIFCYPGDRVPEWFKYKRRTKTSITIQLSLAVDKLLGFVFCSILPRFTSNEMCPSYLECLCYFDDGEKLKEHSRCDMMELYSDHVFLWYDLHCCNFILEGIKRRRGNDEGFTYNPKVSFEFYVVTCDDAYGERNIHDGLIKECGVYPFMTEQSTELALELFRKTKRGENVDEQEQLPPAKELKIL